MAGSGEGGGVRRPPVIMVHGAFCGGWCFDDFRAPFEAAGYVVSAPDLPGHAPGSGTGDVRGRSMRDYAAAVAGWIKACEVPPVLIGHSLGGLVAQLAASKAKVSALVLLAPSPAWGQMTTSAIEAASAFGLWLQGAYWTEAILPDYGVVRQFTLDRLTSAQARAACARMTPESGLALFETLNWWLDFTAGTFVAPLAAGCPVLAITGEADRIHPPATVQLAAARLGGSFQSAPEMSHWLIGEPGWEGVAERALVWLEGLKLGAAAAAA